MKALSLCTGNSCRSQEAWTRKLYPDRFEPYSAGTKPGQPDPRAVQVMTEVGVDISKHRSKSMEAAAGIAIDRVITVCDQANESCPVFPGSVRQVRAGLDDPPRLAAGATTEEVALVPYRRVRDQIGDYVARRPEVVEGPAPGGARP